MRRGRAPARGRGGQVNGQEDHGGGRGAAGDGAALVDGRFGGRGAGRGRGRGGGRGEVPPPPQEAPVIGAVHLPPLPPPAGHQLPHPLAPFFSLLVPCATMRCYLYLQA